MGDMEEGKKAVWERRLDCAHHIGLEGEIRIGTALMKDDDPAICIYGEGQDVPVLIPARYIHMLVSEAVFALTADVVWLRKTLGTRSA